MMSMVHDSMFSDLSNLSVPTRSSISHESFSAAEAASRSRKAGETASIQKLARSTSTGIFQTVTRGLHSAGKDSGSNVVRMTSPRVFEYQVIKDVLCPRDASAFNGFAIVRCTSGLTFKGSICCIDKTPMNFTCEEMERSEKFRTTTFIVKYSSISGVGRILPSRAACASIPPGPSPSLSPNPSTSPSSRDERASTPFTDSTRPEPLPPASPSGSTCSSTSSSTISSFIHSDASFAGLLGTSNLDEEEVRILLRTEPSHRESVLRELPPHKLGFSLSRHVFAREYVVLSKLFGEADAYSLRPDQALDMHRMLSCEKWKLCVRACFRNIVDMVCNGTRAFPELDSRDGFPSQEEVMDYTTWEGIVLWLRKTEHCMLSGSGPTAFSIPREFRSRRDMLVRLGMVRPVSDGLVCFEYTLKESQRIHECICHFLSLSPSAVGCLSSVDAEGDVEKGEDEALMRMLSLCPAAEPSGIPPDGGASSELDSCLDMEFGELEQDDEFAMLMRDPVGVVVERGEEEMDIYVPSGGSPPLRAPKKPRKRVASEERKDESITSAGALCEEQKEALGVVCRSGISVLAAPAGTGKTHTMSFLPAEFCKYWGKSHAGPREGQSQPVMGVCATGQAAKNFTQKTGIKAGTIHSLVHHVWTYMAVVASGGVPGVTIRDSILSMKRDDGEVGGVRASPLPDFVNAFLTHLDPYTDRELLEWSANKRSAASVMKRIMKGLPEKWRDVKHLVIDEYTLLSQTLLYRVLYVARHAMGCSTITFSGDPGQVGSVGYGSVAFDLLDARSVPQAKLSVNHRQDPEARKLTDMCHRVYFSRPIPPVEDATCSSFRVVECEWSSHEDLSRHIRGLFESDTFGPMCKDVANSQFLSHTNETVNVLNSVISSQIFNCRIGPSNFIRPGAKVMFTVNTHTTRFGSDPKMNGAICTVKRCEYASCRHFVSAMSSAPGVASGGLDASGRKRQRPEDGKSRFVSAENARDCMSRAAWVPCDSVSKRKDCVHRIHFEDGTYAFEMDIPIENIRPAYAVTITKYQGSESDYVFVVMDGKHGGLSAFNSQILYSALTRARKSAIVIGSYSKFKQAASNIVPKKSSVLSTILNAV